MNSVVNGIDTLGGMICGFARNNSRERSVKFMKRYMAFHEVEAEALYRLVRCGVSHEGSTKLTIKFFVHINGLRPMPFARLFQDKRDGCLWLDVTELAHWFLEVVKEIDGQDVATVLHHVPVIDPKDVKALDALTHLPLPDILDFAAAAHSAKEREAGEEAARKGLPGSSCSAITPDALEAYKRGLPHNEERDEDA